MQRKEANRTYIVPTSVALFAAFYTVLRFPFQWWGRSHLHPLQQQFSEISCWCYASFSNYERLRLFSYLRELRGNEWQDIYPHLVWTTIALLPCFLQLFLSILKTIHLLLITSFDLSPFKLHVHYVEPLNQITLILSWSSRLLPNGFRLYDAKQECV